MRRSRMMFGGLMMLLVLAGPAQAEMVTSDCVLAADDGTGAQECCWQGACMSAIAQKLGYGEPMNLVYANVLDDGAFSTCINTAGMGTPTALAPCGGGSGCLGAATYVGSIQGCSGYHSSNSGYGHTCDAGNLETYTAHASCLDMYFVRDSGTDDVANAPTWDLGAEALKVAIFPSVDNAPALEHSLEFTVYMSNKIDALQSGTDGESQWVEAKLDRLYMKGWHEGHQADGFVSMWELPPNTDALRYVRVVAGGSAAIYEPPEGEVAQTEIDAVVGVTVQGKPLCAAANDADGDGVCDEDDGCPDVADGLQADTDNDGVGDACDVCPDDPDNDVDEDGYCGNEDN